MTFKGHVYLWGGLFLGVFWGAVAGVVYFVGSCVFALLRGLPL